MNEFESLSSEIRHFAATRNWEKFHSPKNLAMAIAGEAGELAAEFQWLTEIESALDSLNQEKLHAVAMEIADVQIYLLRMADVLAVDLVSSVREKLRINELRFQGK